METTLSFFCTIFSSYQCSIFLYLKIPHYIWLNRLVNYLFGLTQKSNLKKNEEAIKKFDQVALNFWNDSLAIPLKWYFARALPVLILKYASCLIPFINIFFNLYGEWPSFCLLIFGRCLSSLFTFVKSRSGHLFIYLNILVMLNKILI